jgi:hypothetical protein
MIPSQRDSTYSLDEGYFESYTIRVLKMSGWQLALELVKRLDDFDRLDADVERLKIDGTAQEIMKAEKMREREERQIEILHSSTRYHNRGAV